MLKKNSQFSINVRAWDPSFVEESACTKLGCFGSPTSWLCKGYCHGDYIYMYRYIYIYIYIGLFCYSSVLIDFRDILFLFDFVGLSVCSPIISFIICCLRIWLHYWIVILLSCCPLSFLLCCPTVLRLSVCPWLSYCPATMPRPGDWNQCFIHLDSFELVEQIVFISFFWNVQNVK